MKERTSSPNSIRFGLFELDLEAGELLKNGQRVRLQEQPFQVLVMLLERPGQVVTREELQHRLWPANTFVDFDHGLNKAINKIREALGDSADNPRFVETLARRGYRFMPEVTRAVAEELTEVGAQPTQTVESEVVGEVSVHHGRPAVKWVALVLLLLVVLIGGVSWVLDVGLFRDPVSPAVVAIESLAVLPLENLSGDPTNEYFADGMTEALITTLAQIRALRVISRTSVMQYKGSRRSLPEIARDLNVDAVITGSAQEAGGRVKVTVQLIHGATDRHLWASRYEGELSDVFNLQGEVAWAVAKEIRTQVTEKERSRLAATRQVNPNAHKAYLLGRYYWNKRTKEGLEKGIEYFQRAIDEDPNYASAYAGLASCYGVFGANFGDPREFYPQAEVNAARALQIDESLAEAHATMAGLRAFYHRDLTGALTKYRTAIELDPGFATAHQRYSLVLMAAGQVEESLAEIRHALVLDPISLSINTSLGTRLYFARRYDQAVEQLLRALEMDPSFLPARIALGEVYVQLGRHPEAIAQLKEAVKLSREQGLASLGYAYSVAGKRREAQQVLIELGELSKRRYVSPVGVAAIYSGLREKDQAFAWLKRAHQERAFDETFLLVDPRWDPLRSDPRWKSVLRSMNFPDVPGFDKGR
ncbi:MAG: tetratricopeptide repeat protein [Acidobacteriota bacterium]